MTLPWNGVAERFPLGGRLREVEQGPDGAVWLLEDGGKDDPPPAG